MSPKRKNAYKPDIELLKKFFDSNKVHLNFPFLLPPRFTEKKFDEEKFERVLKFCEKWDIEISKTSNFYWIIDKIIPAEVLDAFKKIGDGNNEIVNAINKLKNLEGADLSEIRFKVRNSGKTKTISLKDSFHLNEIKAILGDYFKSVETAEKNNFRSEAYQDLATSLERYLKYEKIEPENSSKRHVIIGRLLIMSALPPRANSTLELRNTNFGKKRVDIKAMDTIDDLQLSDIIRNWIRKSK